MDGEQEGIALSTQSPEEDRSAGALAHATSLGAVSVGAVGPSSVTSTQSEWLSLVLRVTEPLGEQSDWCSCEAPKAQREKRNAGFP